MTKELRDLLDKINNKRKEALDLVNKNKLDLAEKVKNELHELQDKFDLMKELEKREDEEIDNKFENGEVKTLGAEVDPESFINAKMKKEAFINKFTKNTKVDKEDKQRFFNTLKESFNKTSNVDIAIPAQVFGDIIYKAINHSVILGSGIDVVPMNTPKVVVPRTTKNLELKYKQKGLEGFENSLDLEAVTLDAKSIYGYISLAKEDMQDIENLEKFIKDNFALALSESIDKSFLHKEQGAGAEAPKGILDSEDIIKVAGQGNIYDSIALAKMKLSQENGLAEVASYSPLRAYELDTLKDSNNNYVVAPKFMENVKQIDSNSMLDNELMVFDTDSMIIGVRQIADIAIMPNLINDTIIIRMCARVDVATVKENHIALVTLGAGATKTKSTK